MFKEDTIIPSRENTKIQSRLWGESRNFLQDDREM